jgi:hypothetical protein
MKLIMENWKRYLNEQNTNRFFVINNPKILIPSARVTKDTLQAAITIKNLLQVIAGNTLKGTGVSPVDPTMTTHTKLGKIKMDRFKRLGKIGKGLQTNPEIAVAMSPKFKEKESMPHFQVVSELSEIEAQDGSAVYFLEFKLVSQDSRETLATAGVQAKGLNNLIDSLKGPDVKTFFLKAAKESK